MDHVSIFLLGALPVTLTIAALALVIIASYVVRYNPAGREETYWEGYRAGFQGGYVNGKDDGTAEGEALGHRDEYLAGQNFIQCPECDHAVHVPVAVFIDGEPGDQTVRAEPDTTQLWLHMATHTGQTTTPGEDVRVEP